MQDVLHTALDKQAALLEEFCSSCAGIWSGCVQVLASSFSDAGPLTVYSSDFIAQKLRKLASTRSGLLVDCSPDL